MKTYEVSGVKFRIEAQTPRQAVKVAEAYVHEINAHTMKGIDVVDRKELQVEEMKIKTYAKRTSK